MMKAGEDGPHQWPSLAQASCLLGSTPGPFWRSKKAWEGRCLCTCLASAGIESKYLDTCAMRVPPFHLVFCSCVIAITSLPDGTPTELPGGRALPPLCHRLVQPYHAPSVGQAPHSSPTSAPLWPSPPSRTSDTADSCLEEGRLFPRYRLYF